MSKRSKILISGCSYTADCEDAYGLWRFEKIPSGSRPLKFIFPRPSYQCWPELIGKKLDKSVINLASSGSGNYAICKKAQDYIIENHNEIDFVIIALSGWDRLQDLLYRHYGMMSFWVNDHIIEDLKKDKPKLISATLRQIYELQLVCNQYDKKCIFFQMLPALGPDPIEYARKILENPYFNLIEEKYLLGWPFIEPIGGSSFWVKYLKGNKQLQVGEVEKVIQDKNTGHYKIAIERNDPHPNQLGHQVIYEKVMEYLHEIKII